MTDPEFSVCYQHPKAKAVYTCKGCGMKICRVCAFAYDKDKGYRCPKCATTHLDREKRQWSMTTPQKLQPGVNCLHHPKVPAVHLCSKCKTPVCATCDFTFPGDLHICPKCVENNDPVISPRRKRNVIWSLVCAVGGLVLFILFFVRAQGIESESDLEVHSTIFGFLIIVVAMVGVALGLGAMDKRLGNTMSMWIATVWNMVILGAFTLLCVVGLFMS